MTQAADANKGRARSAAAGGRPPGRSWWRYWVKDTAEGALVYAIYAVFRRLPLDWSSAFWGWVLRRVGPHLGAQRRADANLAACFPEMGPQDRRRVLAGMWDNLGRVIGEYPHNEKIWRNLARIEVDAPEGITPEAYADTPLVFFSGHLGNWEIAAACAHEHGFPVSLVFRPPNNRFADRLIRRIRSRYTVAEVPKGVEGVRAVVRTLRQKGNLAILVDQKMNDGIAVPLFGRPAMTSPAIAQFALKQKAVLFPCRIIRLKGAHFRMSVEPAVEVVRTGDDTRDVYDTMVRVHAILERWIREHPDQWLWIHARWPESPRRRKKSRPKAEDGRP